MLITVAIPLIRPFGLPVSITQPTKDLYDAMEALPEGSKVIFVAALAPTGWSVSLPQAVVITKYLIRNNIKMIFLSHLETAPIDYEKLVSLVPEFNDLEYGKDYVFLGFLPGLESGYATMADDIRAVFKNDYYGTPIDSIELMENVNSVKDVDYIVVIDGGGYWGPLFALVHWKIPFGTSVGSACTGVGITGIAQYYQAGQLDGYLDDVKGAAEFESITGIPGKGLGKTDGINSGQLTIVIFIVIGNLGYIIKRLQGGK